MAATEATLGEQIEARWGRFLDLLEPEAKEPGVRAQIQSLRGIGATAVIVLFRRHINAEAELIKAKDDSRPELREKLWLYIELFVELTS
eukprot:tig00020965_g16906.t1